MSEVAQHSGQVSRKLMATFLPWRLWPGSWKSGRAPCIPRARWWWKSPPGCERELLSPHRASWGWTRCWCSWPEKTKEGRPAKYSTHEQVLQTFWTESSCTWMKTEAFFTGSQRNSMVLRCRGCERGSCIPTDSGISARNEYERWAPSWKHTFLRVRFCLCSSVWFEVGRNRFSLGFHFLPAWHYGCLLASQSGLKHLNDYWMNWHEVWHRHSFSPWEAHQHVVIYLVMNFVLECEHAWIVFQNSISLVLSVSNRYSDSMQINTFLKGLLVLTFILKHTSWSLRKSEIFDSRPISELRSMLVQ